MSLIDPGFFWPIAGAVVAGAAIGAEREYRGSPAGFRTHILVALASGLLMLAAVHQVRWLNDTPSELIRIDPVRMAHGILTGIGFLGAGVIFREGSNIRGLTTAASLWITSALGTLFGIGFYGLALGGTITTLAVLTAINLTERFLPRRTYLDVEVSFAGDSGVTEDEFLLSLKRAGFRTGPLRQSLRDGCLVFEAACKRDPRTSMAEFGAALRADPRVVGFDLASRAFQT